MFVCQQKFTLLFFKHDNLDIIFSLANRAPALPGKNLMSLRHPSGHFTFHKVFSLVTHLGSGVWGTLGSRGWVGGVMLVLRTFPELVGRSVQNLV